MGLTNKYPVEGSRVAPLLIGKHHKCRQGKIVKGSRLNCIISWPWPGVHSGRMRFPPATDRMGLSQSGSLSNGKSGANRLTALSGLQCVKVNGSQVSASVECSHFSCSAPGVWVLGGIVVTGEAQSANCVKKITKSMGQKKKHVLSLLDRLILHHSLCPALTHMSLALFQKMETSWLWIWGGRTSGCYWWRFAAARSGR